jgi:hypothetical protein
VLRGLDIDRLIVRSLDVDRLEVTWEIARSSSADPRDFTFQILRSESPTGPFEPRTETFEDRYLFVDGFIPTGNKNRQLWYLLRATHKSTGEVEDFGPAAQEAEPDLVALYIRRHEQTLFREVTGRRCWLLKRRTFGPRCPSCWDSVTQRRTRANCVDCYNTGFLRGYHDPVEVFVQIDPSSKSVKNNAQQIDTEEFTTARMTNFPNISPRDVLIEAENRRWRVMTVTKSERLRAPIKQELQMREIQNTDLEYAVPLNLDRALRDHRASPGRMFSLPSNLDNLVEEEFPNVFENYAFFPRIYGNRAPFSPNELGATAWFDAELGRAATEYADGFTYVTRWTSQAPLPAGVTSQDSFYASPGLRSLLVSPALPGGRTALTLGDEAETATGSLAVSNNPAVTGEENLGPRTCLLTTADSDGSGGLYANNSFSVYAYLNPDPAITRSAFYTASEDLGPNPFTKYFLLSSSEFFLTMRVSEVDNGLMMTFRDFARTRPVQVTFDRNLLVRITFTADPDVDGGGTIRTQFNRGLEQETYVTGWVVPEPPTVDTFSMAGGRWLSFITFPRVLEEEEEDLLLNDLFDRWGPPGAEVTQNISEQLPSFLNTTMWFDAELGLANIVDADGVVSVDRWEAQVYPAAVDLSNNAFVVSTLFPGTRGWVQDPHPNPAVDRQTLTIIDNTSSPLYTIGVANASAANGIEVLGPETVLLNTASDDAALPMSSDFSIYLYLNPDPNLAAFGTGTVPAPNQFFLSDTNFLFGVEIVDGTNALQVTSGPLGLRDETPPRAFTYDQNLLVKLTWTASGGAGDGTLRLQLNSGAVDELPLTGKATPGFNNDGFFLSGGRWLSMSAYPRLLSEGEEQELYEYLFDRWGDPGT